jgi:hypothetical protein
MPSEIGNIIQPKSIAMIISIFVPLKLETCQDIPRQNKVEKNQ